MPLTVRINGRVLEVKDEVHRRKLEVLARFVNGLLAAPAGRSIGKIILYGSVARDEAEVDSDIDLLLFATGQISALEQAAQELAWQLLLREGEHVSSLILPLSDYYHPATFLVVSSLRYGKEVFAMSEAEIRRNSARDNYSLALDYAEAAEGALAIGKVRAAIDNAYNAAELTAKAFLVLEVDVLPTRHGRIVSQLGEIFVLQKQIIPPEIGRKLNLLLDRRHKARYVWGAELTAGMATDAIALARDMIERLRQYLAHTGALASEDRDERAGSS